MSFAIVNDQPPNEKQQILDRQLDELVAETGREEDRYNFAKLILKCLKDRPHLINSVDGSTGRKLTNGEILQKSVKAARALKASGIRTRDVVMIIGVNHLELAIPFYAAFFNAHLPINVDVGSTAFELQNLINISKPKIIFSDAMKVPTAKEALAGAEVKATIISFGDNSEGVETLEEFLRPFNSDVDSFKAADTNRDDSALLLCTSGSTGLPKVPVLTNYCLMAQLPIFTTSDLLIDKSLFKLGTVKNMLIVTSQWFAYYSAISVGAVYSFQRVQTPLPPAPQHVLQILRNHKPHTVYLSPNYVALLLNHPDYRKGDLSCLYTVLVTGSVLTPQIQRELQEAMHPDGIVSYTYGCSELGGGLLHPNSHRVSNSLGEEQNTIQYRIVDEEDKNVPVGQIGELLVKPKERYFKGFLKNEEATNEIMMQDGWLRTGDLVHRNEEGQYFFVDRKKLRITYQNSQIYPTEVESLVSGIEGVLEVAVCGSESGPVGLIVPQPGHHLTDKQIHDFLGEKMSAYKQLVGGIYFVPSLPKTVTGKLDRTKLKTLLDDLHK